MFKSIKTSLSAAAITFGCAVSLLALDANAVTAAELKTIVLQTYDGQSSISGELIRYENNVYILLTEEMGRVQIHADTVVCHGALCPDHG
ncbi:hypothetical protein [Yoonia sp. I 8.24]|uniref:hypothetical protein n=1 Tax=Yoonia sp. I 8.24 TaxID=1537229 RepID=UPI001EDC9B33|nr:hypothetical protein [Yoonia sp. I 8.24]MCG3267856.1 hypothetical protein [Yoonia sp. I 8.24]